MKRAAGIYELRYGVNEPRQRADERRKVEEGTARKFGHISSTGDACAGSRR
jgi:hypothetical protein